jgi:hypothetical protein
MKAPKALKMSRIAQPITQAHISEDFNPQQHCCEQLKISQMALSSEFS